MTRYTKIWLPIALGANIILATATLMTVHEKAVHTKAVISRLTAESALDKAQMAAMAKTIALQAERIDQLTSKPNNLTGNKK